MKWLEVYVKFLKIINLIVFFNDLKLFKNMVGLVLIVGLGEVMYGVYEVFIMKYCIVKYLVFEKGFINLVLEEGWDRVLEFD